MSGIRTLAEEFRGCYTYLNAKTGFGSCLPGN
jgi:hypothetical protein